MTILDHPLVSERYFFPRKEGLQDPCWVELADCRLACWRSPPRPGAVTLLYFHGNGELVSDYLPAMAEALLALDVELVLVEYRGYGLSTGTPSLCAMLDDGVEVMRALALDPRRTVAFGRSVGSIYAIHTVSRLPRMAGLVIESGIADPYERVLMRTSAEELGVAPERLQAEARRWLDHQAKLGCFQGPTLVMHTRFDGLVEVDNAVRLHRWAPEPKELLLFERGTHNSIFAWNQRAYLDKLAEFIGRLSLPA